MHHRRVQQERQRLVADITRLRKHFSSYEPMLQQLRKKYEVSTRHPPLSLSPPSLSPTLTLPHPHSLQSMTKEKTLACLERDRALSEVRVRLVGTQ